MAEDDDPTAEVLAEAVDLLADYRAYLEFASRILEENEDTCAKRQATLMALEGVLELNKAVMGDEAKELSRPIFSIYQALYNTHVGGKPDPLLSPDGGPKPGNQPMHLAGKRLRAEAVAATELFINGGMLPDDAARKVAGRIVRLFEAGLDQEVIGLKYNNFETVKGWHKKFTDPREKTLETARVKLLLSEKTLPGMKPTQKAKRILDMLSANEFPKK